MFYVGLEPTTSGLEVPRAIHCANRTFERCIEKKISPPALEYWLDRLFALRIITAQFFFDSRTHHVYLRSDESRLTLHSWVDFRQHTTSLFAKDNVSFTIFPLNTYGFRGMQTECVCSRDESPKFPHPAINLIANFQVHMVVVPVVHPHSAFYTVTIFF